jgi:hypothetical protein
MHGRGKMIMKRTLILVCLSFLWGCAGIQPQTTFENNTFTCDFPELKVRILKPVLKLQEKSQQISYCRSTAHIFTTGPGEVVGITIWRCTLDSNTEWQSSDAELVRSLGALPLDPITINNQIWVKFVQLQNELALFGYFKRMGDNSVAVYNLIKAEHYKDDIENFAKERVLSDPLKLLINKTFSDMDKLFVIG